MLYYKIKAYATKPTEKEPDEAERYALSLRSEFESFYQKNDNKLYLFVVDINVDLICAGGIAIEPGLIEKKLSEFWNILNVEVKDVEVQEITLASFEDLLFGANHNVYLRDRREILKNFELEPISNNRSVLHFIEKVYQDEKDKETLMKDAKNIVCEESLCPELERIFTPPTVKVKGHPVHYLVRSNSKIIRNNMVKILQSALYETGRISTRRYATVTFISEHNFSYSELSTLYKSLQGGLLFIDLCLGETEDSDVRMDRTSFILEICQLMQVHKNDVLTVFGMRRDVAKIKDMVYSDLDHITLVELDEELIIGEKAKDYLKTLASNSGVPHDDKLLACVANAEKGFLAADLNKEFDFWFANKLKTDVYSQYSTMSSVGAKKSIATPKGSAYNDLQNLIGLENAKKVIKQAVNYYKAQQLFRDKGMATNRASMHMVFTGNPGTAKTTVARLFAEIMKENGILSHGDLFEVGRADIVGQYVGQTAPLVQKMFRKARGSVLFIDEAYSLVEERGLYGDEAINTIVQEMENNRDDLIVIFAGYPEEMEKFLDRNPGLRSRIAFHVPFEDYNTQELVEITDKIANEQGLTFTADAKEKLTSVLASAREDSDFGNGRYARNLVERARMAQAERLVSMDFDSVTCNDVATLIADDIPECEKSKKKLRIGFSA